MISLYYMSYGFENVHKLSSDMMFIISEQIFRKKKKNGRITVTPIEKKILKFVLAGICRKNCQYNKCSMIHDPYKTRMIGWYLNETVSDRKYFSSLICRKWIDIGIKMEGSGEIRMIDYTVWRMQITCKSVYYYFSWKIYSKFPFFVRDSMDPQQLVAI